MPEGKRGWGLGSGTSRPDEKETSPLGWLGRNDLDEDAKRRRRVLRRAALIVWAAAVVLLVVALLVTGLGGPEPVAWIPRALSLACLLGGLLIWVSGDPRPGPRR